MANIWEKAKSILAGNLNSGLNYVFTTVTEGLYNILKDLPSKEKIWLLSWV